MLFEHPCPPMKIPLHLIIRPFSGKNSGLFLRVLKLLRLSDGYYKTVGTREKTYKWNPAVFPSPVCAICTSNCSEVLFHLTVGRGPKWKYRSEVVLKLNLLTYFPNKLTVWSALASFFCATEPLTRNRIKTVPGDILVLVGTAFSTL